MKPINVGLLGLGTVGAGTIEVLRRNAEEISRRAGRDIRITHATARDITKPRAVSLEGIKVVAEAMEIVSHPDIDIVCELIGGETTTKDLVLKAIENGKHVVTANKALLAKHGNEIFAAAQRKKVMVAFEAAVAGGVPIIKALREGLMRTALSGSRASSTAPPTSFCRKCARVGQALSLYCTRRKQKATPKRILLSTLRVLMPPTS